MLCYNHISLDETMESAELDKLVEYSAEVLLKDGVILTPTDTVYGLICLPSSPEGIRKIYEMKDRPVQKHLPIIVADGQQAKTDLPIVWSTPAQRLADSLWPGALTIAFGLEENNIPWLEGRVEVGIRAPKHNYIQKLARKMGPLFMTSANRSGKDTPHTVDGALESLVSRPKLVIDGGTLSGLPSTLVNVNLPEPRVERVGSVPESEIERIIRGQ